MKIITIILSAIILNACGGAKDATNTAKNVDDKSDVSATKQTEENKMQQTAYNIEYSASTRGSSLMVSAKDGKLRLQENGEAKPGAMEISQKQTLGLLSELNKVDVKKLSELKAPSNASHYDGAMAATLKIIKDGETYQTPAFDHGNPPEEIKGLVDYILSLSKG